MTRKIFACFRLLLIFTLTIFGTAEAKSQAELTDINAYDVDENTLRIEINFKGKLDSEDISIRTSGKFLVADLNNSTPGRVSKIAGKNISDNLVEKISVGEFKINQTRMTAALAFPVDEKSLNFSVEPPVKSEKKSSRVVIDIPKNSFSKNSYENFDITDKVVVLDAGHGGSDKGAVGPSGVTEKSVTLAVALKTEKLFKESGAKVVMTRKSDVDVASPYASDSQELQSRVNKAPPSADIFISIHCNAFTNPNTNGMETFYYSGSYASKKLAQLLNEELLKYGERLNRGVKSANFYVLKHTRCPASLIELAFVTNPTEENLLADDDYQNKLAQAISTAVKRYFDDENL